MSSFRRVYLLLILLALAAVLVYWCWSLAALAFCGVFGCTNVGLIQDGGLPIIAVALLLISGVIAVVPFWAVPWTTNRTLRVAISIAAPLAVVLLGAVTIVAANPTAAGW